MRIAVVLAVATVALLARAVPATAHDVLRSTSPAAGSVVETLPAVVVLTFDDPALAIGTEVVVTGPAGSVVSGRPRLVDDDVRQPVGGGPAGRYTVLWKVTSADGHPVSGTFEFTTRQARAESSGSSDPTGPGVSPAAGPATSPAASPAAEPPTSSAGGPVALGVVVLALLVVALVAWTLRRRRGRG